MNHVPHWPLNTTFTEDTAPFEVQTPRCGSVAGTLWSGKDDMASLHWAICVTFDTQVPTAAMRPTCVHSCFVCRS
jgi:hypothetical protein